MALELILTINKNSIFEYFKAKFFKIVLNQSVLRTFKRSDRLTHFLN